MKNVLNSYDELSKMSFQVPAIVSKATQKSNNFVEALEQWLLKTEEVMEKNRIIQCSEIAGLRSKIINAQYTSEIASNKKRKHVHSVAVSIVYDAQSTLLAILEPMETRISEAREAIRQLLGVAYQAEMIDVTLEFNHILNTLWQTFSTHEQLKGLTSKVLVYVDKNDAMRILAEEIDLSYKYTS